MKTHSFLLSLLVVFFASQAMAEGKSFSADAIQQRPGQPAQSGKLYIGDKGARFEFTTQGRRIVQIVSSEGRMDVLFPQQKTYMQVEGQAGHTPGRGAKVPCKPAPNLACTKSGSETIGGVVTERWAKQPQGAPKAVVIFWDPQRSFAIRQQLPNGNIAEMRKIGEVDYEGRKVEKWQMVTRSGAGERPDGELLYDPELEITVREQHSNGFLRELKNIKLGALDAALFTVPSDYRKMQLPRGSGPLPRGTAQRP